MEVTTQHFHGLDAIMDELHALFDTWESDGALHSHLDANTVQLLRLALHEWVANIVQHADFADNEPRVTLQIVPNGRRVKCIVEDNSNGFPFMKELALRERALEPFPERGMGLLMLDAATESFTYAHSEDGRQKLEFTVSGDKESWLNIPF